jgi:hypothetical protein
LSIARQLSEELSAAELENIKGYLQKLSKNIRHRLYVGSSEVKDLEQNA